MKNKPNYAARCKACNAILESFNKSKPLPDGSFDDLCPSCKEAISLSSTFRYTEYTCGDAEDGDQSEILHAD